MTIKFLWHSIELGETSDNFNSYEECYESAKETSKKYPDTEFDIYSYDADKFPDNNPDIDDCFYHGFMEWETCEEDEINN